MTVKKLECNLCHVEKPLADFYDSKSSKNGKSTRCIPCAKLKAKESYNNRKTLKEAKVAAPVKKAAKPKVPTVPEGKYAVSLTRLTTNHIPSSFPVKSRPENYRRLFVLTLEEVRTLINILADVTVDEADRLGDESRTVDVIYRDMALLFEAIGE